jgi:hypothetical protein
LVNGHLEKFRLVGMDHFNAMFEDGTTGSWWRQGTGDAVAGPLKGAQLPVMAASQVSLRKWLSLHPDSLVMQPNEASEENYDAEWRFERGKSKGDLTRTDPGSWKEKSWVVGIEVEFAYDIHSALGPTNHLIAGSIRAAISALKTENLGFLPKLWDPQGTYKTRSRQETESCVLAGLFRDLFPMLYRWVSFEHLPAHGELLSRRTIL